MASTNGSGSNAKKAAFEAAYAALKAGKQPSQAEINKIYNQALNQTSQNTGTSVQNTHYSAVDKSTEWGNYSTVAKKPTASTTQNVHYSVANNWIDQKKNQPGTSTTQQEDSRTTKQKYDDAKKAYDDYIGSDERAQKVKDMNKVSLQDAMSRMFNVAGGPSSDALMGSGYMQSAPEDTKEKELSATVEHYRQQLQKEEDQRIMDADLKELESWSEEDRNNLDRYIAERDQHAYNALNPMLGTQFDTYNLNPIVEKYGVGKVRQMAESLQRNQNAETTAKAEEAAKNTANKRPWLGGTLGSLASVGANLAGAYTGPLGYAVETGQRTGRYSTLDPNNIGNLPSVYGETVRSEVAQNIRGDEESTNWLRNLAAFGYQGGMSALDSAARIAASGGSAGISSAIAASGAFSNGLRQYSQQGASPEQAAAMALADAGLEYITEKLPTEKVLSVFKKGNTKNAVREVLTQAFLVEPTSEEVNLFAGVAAEALILGDKNSKSQRVGELIANGMSYEEAQAQVYKELWNEALQTYAVSAFSGLASSGSAAIIGNAVNGNQQQETPQQAAPAASVEQQQQNFVEATGEQLAQQMPKPEEPAPLTEGQQHLENAVAKLLGVNDEHKNTASNEAAIMQNQDESTFESEKEVKGTGAAEQNFSGKAQYQDLLFEGNVQPDRANDSRAMEVPKVDVDGNPVSAVAANVYGSKYTTDDLASETESAIARGDLSYMPISNSLAVEKATQKIEQTGGWQEAYTLWHDAVRDGRTGAEMAARGALLLNHAAEVYEQTKSTGEAAAMKEAKQHWMSILMDVREMGTNTAQGLQAMRMIRELAPPDKLDFAVASVKRMASDMRLQNDVQIDEKLLNEYRAAETDDQRNEVMGKIQQNVADQIPSTLLDKWTALRYTNMLGNLKTQVRNFAGNVGSMIAYRVKDQVAAGVEDVVSLFSKNYTRQKAHFVSRKALQFGKDDFNSFKGAVNNGGKFSERIAADGEFEQGVMDKRRIFKSDAKNAKLKKVANVVLAPMEGYRRTTNWLMNNEYFGDEAFSRAAYARALAGFLKANGVTAEQFRHMAAEKPGTPSGSPVSIIPDGTKVKASDRNNYGTIVKYNADDNTYLVHFVSPQGREANVTLKASEVSPIKGGGAILGKVPDKERTADFVDYARAYAIREAQEATFKDNSALAQVASKLQKAGGIVGQGIVPFTKTPANVLTRAVEFSPAGILDTAVKSAKAIAGSENVTGADVVNSLAKTITGTGLVALGALLWDRGLLSGGPDEDDEKEQFDKMNGAQNYALQFQDRNGEMHSYTFDWLTPVVIPMFMGAELWKAVTEADGEATFADYVDLFTAIADPMIQMSMLQGLNDSLDGIKYTDNNLGQFFINATISYLTQGLTNTLVGQLERSTEKNRMTTYVDANSEMPAWMQRTLGKTSQKIPGWDFQQMEYRNRWGETEENEGGLLYNLLSPGYLSTEKNDAVMQELYRLKDAQTENVAPKEIPKKVSYTDKQGVEHKNEPLTQEQYQTLATTQGQTAKKVLDQLIASEDYKALTDSQKAAAVNAVYDYASEQGKIAALQDYDSNAAGWIKDATTDPMGAVVKKVVEADLSDAMGEMVSAWKNKHSDAEAKADLENVYAVYKSLSKETQKAIRENAEGRLGYFLTASESGVKADVFTELYKTYWDLDGSKSDASTKANRWAFTLERAQETGKITQAQKNTLKKEMNFVQVIPAEAKKFDELTSSGLSATDAQSVGRTVSYLMPEEGYKQVRDIQVIEQIAKMTLDDISKDAAMRSYMTDNQEEKFDTVVSMGYSPEEYAQIYRIIDGYTSGTGKKARTIAYLQDEYGISYGTAKTLYEVFK